MRTGIAFQVGHGRVCWLAPVKSRAVGAADAGGGRIGRVHEFHRRGRDFYSAVVLGLTGRLSISPGRLMMPMAFAALLSGLLTLIATPP